MKADLMRKMAEEQERDTKAEACEVLVAIAGNAIQHMLKQMPKEDVASVLGISTDMINAIDIEDFDMIAKG